MLNNMALQLIKIQILYLHYVNLCRAGKSQLLRRFFIDKTKTM